MPHLQGAAMLGWPCCPTVTCFTSSKMGSGLPTACGAGVTARNTGRALSSPIFLRCTAFRPRRPEATSTSASASASACGADRRDPSVGVEAAMLDARYVADHFDEVRAALGRRSGGAATGLDGLVELSARRR